jgi:CheY-like chemotaxis protein
LTWKLECYQELGLNPVKTILVVDDSRFLRITTERTLVRAGYNVVTACDGEDALRVAADTRPDLILLDMLLPKLSGPEVLRRLRTTEQTALIPIVVLSSLPQSNEAKLKRDGASAYFDKSGLGLHEHSESLVQIVNRMFDESRQQQSDDLADLNLPPVQAKGGL